MPCTTWAGGVHPLGVWPPQKPVKPPKPPKPKAIPKPRPKKPEIVYSPVNYPDMTKFIKAHPGCTAGQIRIHFNAIGQDISKRLRVLADRKSIIRSRESEKDVWTYIAKRIEKPVRSGDSKILKCIKKTPGITSDEIKAKTKIPGLWSKLQRLTKAKEITAIRKMTPNHWREINHYSLSQTA